MFQEAGKNPTKVKTRHPSPKSIRKPPDPHTPPRRQIQGKYASDLPLRARVDWNRTGRNTKTFIGPQIDTTARSYGWTDGQTSGLNWVVCYLRIVLIVGMVCGGL